MGILMGDVPWRVRTKRNDPDLEGYSALAEKIGTGSNEPPGNLYDGQKAAVTLRELRSLAVTGKLDAAKAEILDSSTEIFRTFLETISPEYFPGRKSMFVRFEDGTVDAKLYGNIYPTADTEKLNKNPSSGYLRRYNEKTGGYEWVNGPFGHIFVIRRFPPVQLALPLGDGKIPPKIFRQDTGSQVFLHIANEGKLEDIQEFWKDDQSSDGFVAFWPISEYTPIDGRDYIRHMGFGEPDGDLVLYQRLVTPEDLAANAIMSALIENAVCEMAKKSYQHAMEYVDEAQKGSLRNRRKATRVMEAHKRLKEYCESLAEME